MFGRTASAPQGSAVSRLPGVTDSSRCLEIRFHQNKRGSPSTNIYILKIPTAQLYPPACTCQRAILVRYPLALLPCRRFTSFQLEFQYHILLYPLVTFQTPRGESHCSNTTKMITRLLISWDTRIWPLPQRQQGLYDLTFLQGQKRHLGAHETPLL